MARTLQARKSTQILMDSFAFLSMNFTRLALFFILPVALIFFSGILLRTGFSPFKSSAGKPFTLHVLQGKDEKIFINGKKPFLKRKPGSRETVIEGLPRHDSFLLKTEKRISLPPRPGAGYLIRKGGIRRIKRELVRRVLIKPQDAMKKTAVLVLRRPGWHLLADGKQVSLIPTSSEMVGAVLYGDISKMKLRIVHTKRVKTGNQKRGQVDGLEFTYGSPTRPLEDWVNITFQIGTIFGLFIILTFLLSFLYTDFFSGERVHGGTVARVFRATGIKTAAAILFLFLILIIILIMLWNTLMMGGGNMLMFMVPLVLFLAARIIPTPFISQVEGHQPWQALVRSFRLTRGTSIRFFLTLSVIAFVMIIYLNLAGVVTAEILGIDRDTISSDMTRIIGPRLYIWPEASLLFLGVICLLTVPLLPVIMYFLYNLYIDVRIRREMLEGKDATALLGKPE